MFGKTPAFIHSRNGFVALHARRVRLVHDVDREQCAYGARVHDRGLEPVHLPTKYFLRGGPAGSKTENDGLKSYSSIASPW